MVVQLAHASVPDAPNIFYGELLQGFFTLFVGVHQADAFVSFVFLGKLGGYLGKGFRGGDAQRYGDAGALVDVAYHLLAVVGKLLGGAHSAEVEKGFVDGVDIYLGRVA